MDKIYGKRPLDLGLVDISPKEMMFWLYCPIKLPSNWQVEIPPNLQQFTDIVQRVFNTSIMYKWIESYVYLTAKTLWVTADNPGNRPG